MEVFGEEAEKSEKDERENQKNSNRTANVHKIIFIIHDDYHSFLKECGSEMDD